MVKAISSSSNANIPVPTWILRHHSPSSIHSIALTSNCPHSSSPGFLRSKRRKLCPRYVIASDSRGLVSITDLKDYRPIAFWKAHGKGLEGDLQGQSRRLEDDSPVLGVEILRNGWILTHGRDNDIHIWTLPPSHLSSSRSNDEVLALPPSPLPSALLESLIKPVKIFSMKVNSLNFCRFSCIFLPEKDKMDTTGKQKDSDRGYSSNGIGVETGAGDSQVDLAGDDSELLLAVPNTLKAEWIDIYHIPSAKRIHEAIGRQRATGSNTSPAQFSSSAPRPSKKSTVEDDQEVEEVIGSESAKVHSDGRTAAISGGELKVEKWGITMSLHLFYHTSYSSQSNALHLLAGYEDGSVALLRFSESKVWERLWRRKGHNEPVMSLTCSPKHNVAFSVGADENISKYILFPSPDGDKLTQDAAPDPDERIVRTFKTKHAGRSTVDLSTDGKVLAVGGWDGNARLYSATSSNLKSLGTLKYHKDGIQALSFCHIDQDPTLPTQPNAEGKEEKWQDKKFEQSVRSDGDDGYSDSESDSESESEIEGQSYDASPSNGDLNQASPKTYCLAIGGKDGRVSIWRLAFGRLNKSDKTQ